MKTLLRLTILGIVGGLLMPIECFAQGDNPFGGPDPAASGFGAPVPENALPSGAIATLPDDNHPVVQSLRRNPPKSDVEVSRAILYMLRIERWDEIGRYLDQLTKFPIDEANALKMERAAGLDTWLNLAGQADKLNENQRGVAQKVIDLSSGAARDSATLNQAISLLHSTELLDRKRGVLAIQAAGETGLAAMLESVVREEKYPSPIMSETIITMGDEGEAALKAALAAPDLKARERLLLVAARIPGSSYIAQLASSIYTIPSDGDAYRQVLKMLSPAGQALPQAAASQRYVLAQMESQLNEFKAARNETTSSIYSLWRWSPDGKRLITELEDTPGMHLERAYQLANLALQLGPQLGVDPPLATAVILERNYRLAPTLDLEPGELRKIFVPGAQFDNPEYLGAVLEAARKANLWAAQLRAVQALGLTLHKNSIHDSESLQRLSETLKNSPAPIRYVAALALRQRPESESRFEGKLAYEQTIREMQSLEGKPLALVVGGSGDLRDSLSKHLSLLGVRTLGASSGRETLRLIQEPQPIEYVFLVDRVIDMSLSELVQRLRASPRTIWLPMAVMTDQIGPTQREILQDARFQAIHFSTLTSNIDFTATLFSEMRQRSPLPRMDAIDRLSFRAIVEPVAKSK